MTDVWINLLSRMDKGKLDIGRLAWFQSTIAVRWP